MKVKSILLNFISSVRKMRTTFIFSLFYKVMPVVKVSTTGL